jgi:hypothetical protein
MTDRDRDEAEPVTVYGKAHGDMSTIATDDDEKEQG